VTRLLHEAKKPIINTSFASNLSNQQNRDLQLEENNPLLIIEEKNDEETLYKHSNSPELLEKSITTDKFEPAVSKKISMINPPS
jgi:hypothetical protein